MSRIDLEELACGLADLGLDDSERTLELLGQYADLLLKWNKVYNLTAIRNPSDVLTHHLLDSASLIPMIERQAPKAESLLDVGCGGGLPCVIVAILRPDVMVTGIDAVGKKAAFVNQVAIELGLKNLSAKHGRVEKLSGFWDVITSRAFASLEDFVRLTDHLLSKNGCWLAMKGTVPSEELSCLPTGVTVRSVDRLSVPGLSEERHLVTIAKG